MPVNLNPHHALAYMYVQDPSKQHVQEYLLSNKALLLPLHLRLDLQFSSCIRPDRPQQNQRGISRANSTRASLKSRNIMPDT